MWTQIFKIYSFWELSILILIFFACLTLFVVLTRPSVQVGDKFNIGFKNKSRKKLPPHANCPNRMDIIEIEQLRRKTFRQIDYLEFKGILSTKMKYVEEKMNNIKEKMIENYTNLLKPFIKDADVTSHVDFIHYNSLVQAMLFLEIKGEVLMMFKENEIPEPSSDGFETYIKRKTILVYEKGKAYMDLWYCSQGKFISRETLRESVKRNLHNDFTEAMRDILLTAFKIDVEKTKEINDLLDELKKQEELKLGFLIAE